MAVAMVATAPDPMAADMAADTDVDTHLPDPMAADMAADMDALATAMAADMAALAMDTEAAAATEDGERRAPSEGTELSLYSSPSVAYSSGQPLVFMCEPCLQILFLY